MICGGLEQEAEATVIYSYTLTIISNWLKTYSCFLLAKNVAAFYPCPKNLPKPEVKSNKTNFFDRDFRKAYFWL